MNRHWIGIDITYQSISLILKRLADKYPDTWPQIEANILLDGVPRDMASAVALANRKDDKTRKEFEKWAVQTYSNHQAQINDKKGADGGIDGVAYFLIDKGTNGKAIFQVKSGGANRATLATLNSDRQREKAEFGLQINLARALADSGHPHPALAVGAQVERAAAAEWWTPGQEVLPFATVPAQKSNEPCPNFRIGWMQLRGNQFKI